jgi:hypothetical protein
MWAADRGAVAGKAGLHIRSEDGTSHVLSDYCGFGTVAPTSFFDIEKRGTDKAVTDFIELTNRFNAADMDGTGTAILWNQWYYDAVTPAVADAGRIAVIASRDWGAAATQDAYMSFQTALAGTVAERWQIGSTGAFSNTGSLGTAYIHLKAGTAAASTAPIKLTTGVLNATAEIGAFEYLTPTLYFTAVQRLAVPGTMYAMATQETISTSNAELALYDDANCFGTRTIAAGNLDLVGKTVRITAAGTYHTLAANPGTLQIRVKFVEADATTVVVLDTGAQGLTEGVVNQGWYLSGVVTVNTVAAAGSVYAQGKLNINTTATAVQSWDMEDVGGIAVDTNNDEQTVTMTGQFSVSDADNTITCTNFIIEILN